MDTPLTPSKIQRLIHIAEHDGSTLNIVDPVRTIYSTDTSASARKISNVRSLRESVRCESSSGILDLDQIEAFGDSASINTAMSKSTSFNPGELTGRSTEADDISFAPKPVGIGHFGINMLANQLSSQSNVIQNVVRHSISSNFSKHTRDLTQDEAVFGLVAAPGSPLMQQATYNNIQDGSANSTNSNLSVGAYFMNHCSDFGKMFRPTPATLDNSNLPSITEVSTYGTDNGRKTNRLADDTLDSVPVRQPREKSKKQILNDQPHVRTTRFELPKENQKPKPELEIPDMTEKSAKSVNQTTKGTIAQKSFMKSSKPKDVLLKNLHTSFKHMSEDVETSMENSVSISKIQDYLAGEQSNVSVSDIMKMNQVKSKNKSKHPLSELQTNIQEQIVEDVKVMKLGDSRKTETASSAATISTVVDRTKRNDNASIPDVVITENSIIEDAQTVEEGDNQRFRTKSSSKSPSTLSTVRENYYSFKSDGSPANSSSGTRGDEKGDVNLGNRSFKAPSPDYKELDKSVDWRDVLQQKRYRQLSLAKEDWAEVALSKIDGYVGVRTAATISFTTLSVSWLTARFKLDELPNDKDINIEMPRLPILLSPGQTENFKFHVTCNVEMNANLPFTVSIKDTQIDGEQEIKGHLEMNFKIPNIQAMSADGMNKIIFPPTRENSSMIKSLIIVSDCPEELQLALFMAEGGVFTIRSVQEIKKSDVSKVLLERQTPEEEAGKKKSKGFKKQVCKLTSGNAIKVNITFNAPKLSDTQISESNAVLNGTLSINLIEVNTLLKQVDLAGTVGYTNLVVNLPDNTINITNDPVTLSVSNTGTLVGVWEVKLSDNNIVSSPATFELSPGACKAVNVTYVGAEAHDALLVFEDMSTHKHTSLQVNCIVDKPKAFPIKTSHNNLSWVRPGKKDISLKNFTDKKVMVRCRVVGEGFTIDVPGMESRGETYCVQFNPNERRNLSIIFTPTSSAPYHAALHLYYDKNSEFSRKVFLFGSWSGECVRWSGLVTYSDTALVRATSHAPVELKLYNKAATPAFFAARVHFNLQYMSAAASSHLTGSNRVVGGRARHSVVLRVDWPRVERCIRHAATTALATVTVLTGAELTRRRILKILKNNSSDGQLDTELLTGNLGMLVERFEGEDESMDNLLADFNENKDALRELMSGLQELTAHIDLPQDFAEDTTIMITDDTVVDHHTLCE